MDAGRFSVQPFLAEKLTKSPKLHPLPNSEEVCIIGDKNRTLLTGIMIRIDMTAGCSVFRSMWSEYG